MDLISRQDAIEAIKEDKIDLTNPNVVAVFKATGDFEKVETQVMTCDRHIEILKDLPSAQLEEIRETGISRYGVAAWLDNMGYTKLAYAVMDKDRFPSAQPERKRGKWIKSHEHVYMCNEVKEWTNWYCSECDAPNSWPTDYCPNCGARMEVDDESN